jgi:hypothetical protein
VGNRRRADRAAFNFGFFNDTSWNFSTKQWETQLIPGTSQSSAA